MGLYNITNANQIIDVNTIKEACDQIDKAAGILGESKKSLDDATTYIGGDALRVDGRTMEEAYQQLTTGLETKIKEIKNYTDSIRKAANDIYYKQSQELSNYLKQQAQQ